MQVSLLSALAYWSSDYLSMQAAGPLIAIKRIRDANGVPKAFGFAEYSDGESVLRCLELINNIPLPSGQPGVPDRNLSVKADDKTRGRLNAFQSSKDPTKDEVDAEAMEQAQNYLRSILTELREAGGSDKADSGAQSRLDPDRRQIQHLQDLGPEDLPEESRGIITKEIAFFRERAAKKEADRKAAQAEKDRTAGLAAAHFGRSNTTINQPAYADQGYQQRGPPPDEQNRRQDSPPQRNMYNDQQQLNYGDQPPQQQQQYGQRSGGFAPRGGRGGAFGNYPQRGGYQQQNNQRQWGRQDDSQGYNKPVGFVRAGDEMSPHGDDARRGNGHDVNEDDLPDEERERLRQDRKRRDAEWAFRDVRRCRPSLHTIAN